MNRIRKAVAVLLVAGSACLLALSLLPPRAIARMCCDDPPTGSCCHMCYVSPGIWFVCCDPC